MIWTICFLVKDDKVCLAMKKRGHGAGRWNGTGGKPEQNESLEDTSIRETREEIGVELLQIEKVAEIEFKELPTNITHTAVAYISREWEGEPSESEEMKPAWFGFQEIPYEEMWEADRVWIPLVLEGKKLRAVFEYSEKDVLAAHTVTLL